MSVRKRVPASYECVVSGGGTEGAGLPHFSSRLYREVKLLQNALDNCMAEKSLEIGCGFGRLSPWTMEYSKDHYAVEPEEKLFRSARKLDPQSYVYKAKKLPFPDGSFDLCLTWTVLQHILPKEQTKAAEEIKRVAKKTSRIIVAEGTGTFQGESEWLRTVEGWSELFKPWRLVWQTDRVLEVTADKDQGKVMRFERDE